MSEKTVHKIIICQGIQGSGKSTWARNWAQEDPSHRVRWNNDDMRLLMGQYWVPSREPLLSKIRALFMNTTMDYGFDIVIDDMNLNPHTTEYYEVLVQAYNATHEDKYVIEYRLFNTPLDVCIERDAKRKNPIGAKVLTDTYTKYEKLIAELDEKYYNSETNYSQRFWFS